MGLERNYFGQPPGISKYDTECLSCRSSSDVVPTSQCK